MKILKKKRIPSFILIKDVNQKIDLCYNIDFFMMCLDFDESMQLHYFPKHLLIRMKNCLKVTSRNCSVSAADNRGS